MKKLRKLFDFWREARDRISAAVDVLRESSKDPLTKLRDRTWLRLWRR